MSISLRHLLALAVILLIILTGIVYLDNKLSTGSGSIAESHSSNAELIARGEYLAIAGNCASCHTAPNGEFLAGGLAFETPFGTIYSTNITPDEATGIGGWTEWDFLNSIRHGVRPNGEHLYPVFPFTSYTKITNEDIAAVFAYLKSVPPVAQAALQNKVSFPFNIRLLLAFWKTMFFEPGAFVPVEGNSQEWNRGAYLVRALAHCGACHSPRNRLGAVRANLTMSGGEYFDRVRSEAHRPWSAPNLTSTQRGLGLWSHEDLGSYLKTARNDFIESFGPMNEVIMNNTRHLTNSDVSAMATYLRSLPAIDEAAGQEPSQLVLGRGRTIYNLHCGTCHLPTGEGDPEMAPRLNAGSLVVQSDNPASMINTILYGPEPPKPPLPAKWRNPMDEFQYLLDDEEVAAVASFIRHSWKNAAGAVTPEQVSRQR